MNINHSLHVSKCHFSKQQQSSAIIWSCEAIIGGFGDHIGEVNTLSKHVTSDWSFRRGNSKALGKNTGVIGETRTVPEKLTVLEFAEGLKKIVEYEKDAH